MQAGDRHPAVFIALVMALVTFTAVADSVPALPSAANEAASGTALKMRGAGSFSKWFFHVFDASLWTPDGRAWSQSEPFALVLRYARSFSRGDIVGSTVDQWKKLGNTTPAERKRWVPAMRHVFRDVASGDRLIGVHKANGATVFFYNGSKTGAIDDPGFAKAFFAIWLSPKTQSPDLRRALLEATGNG